MKNQNKVRKTYSIDQSSVDLVETKAKKEDRSKSSVVNRAIKESLK